MQTFTPFVSQKVKNASIGIAENEFELQQMLNSLAIKRVGLEDPSADILIVSAQTIEKQVNSAVLIAYLEKALQAGKHVVVLDAGPQYLGQGYKNNLGTLQSAPVIKSGKKTQIGLPFGISANFKELAEPESHIQYAEGDSSLWNGLQKNSGWLFNGYRGGLVLPAADMEFAGLNSESYLKSWKDKGADENQIKNGPAYAYELEGFYSYSSKQNDADVKAKLRNKVHFLVEDAPALKTRINPDAEIISYDLFDGYKKSQGGAVKSLHQLVSAGKDLVRSPVVMLEFQKTGGKLIISQLLTAKRLQPSYKENGLYGLRYDPVAVQFVLNMIDKLLTTN